QKLVECHAMSLSATTAFHDQAFALRSGVVPMAQWKWKPVVYVFSLTAAALGFASHAKYFHVHIWPVILGAISTFPFVSWIEISLLGSGGLIAAFFSQDDPEKLHNMDVMKALPKAVEEFLLKRPTPTDRPIIFSGPILDLLNQLGGAKFKAKPEHEKIQTVAHV